MKKLTTEEVIKRGEKIYGNIYDFSKTNYVNIDTKITVICPKHGEFQIRPDHFFEGCGCPKCGSERGGDKNRSCLDEFIEKAKEVHGDIYDYSKVTYVNARKKVCIICPKHGEFWQTPDAHLRGVKCPKCAHRSYKYTTEEFIKIAKEIHGDKYDYSKVVYKGRKIPVCIICPKHGEFWQKPSDHFRGHGCPICNESCLENEIKLFLSENNIEYEAQKHFSWLRNKWPMSLDFYLPKYKIAIECQGEQHFKNREFFHQNVEERIRMDLLKKELCNNNGIEVLYYSSKYLIPKDWDKYKVICSKTKLLEVINQYV
jgi:hypothetical protein